jgi:hypothetical protein
LGLRRFFSILRMDNRGMGIAIDKKRNLLSLDLSNRMKHIVKYGPFKGMKLSQENWWGSYDRASMLLGIYEKEVLESMMTISKKRDVFVDLGAADGYYSIGTLISRRFKKSYSFEISSKGRDVIQKNAILNRVNKKLEIFGEATKDFYKHIPINHLNKAVILIDIEGGEFNLLDKEVFESLKRSIIFVEIHEWFFKDGEKKLKKLLNDAKPYFKISTLTTGSRDLSVFPELSSLIDSDRWLIASEGRARLMTWLRLDPI